MYQDTHRNLAGLAAVLVAAVAAVHVFAFTLVAMPDAAPGQGLPRAADPALLPEIVVTAPRIAS